MYRQQNMNVEDWQERSVVLSRKVNTRNLIIGVLTLVIFGLVYTLVFSINGWSSTKTECNNSRQEISEIRKILSDKKPNQDIKCQQKNLYKRW